MTLFASQSILGQTFNVIHAFNGADGSAPVRSLAMDRAGNLYGATITGGNYGPGTVFMLRQTHGVWVLTTLCSFPGYVGDGQYPQGGPAVASSGVVYGTTNEGGRGFGTVYAVAPPTHAAASVRQPWNETIIHSFSGGLDGGYPYSSPVLDRMGNLYGVTSFDGQWNGGVLYQLESAGGGWIESVLYSFCALNNCADGEGPFAGPIFDSAGNLYGTTEDGGTGDGVVYELSHSPSGWTEQVLHSFSAGDGAFPEGSLIFDQAGNLYGTTTYFGPNGGGTVFELTPSNNGWNFSLLYAITGPGTADFPGPEGGLLLDRSGNLWGTTNQTGNIPCGNIFKLTPSQGAWAYTDVHDFTCGDDGGNPTGSLLADTSGNIYGTASSGGAYRAGVVFEVTP